MSAYRKPNIKRLRLPKTTTKMNLSTNLALYNCIRSSLVDSKRLHRRPYIKLDLGSWQRHHSHSNLESLQWLPRFSWSDLHERSR